MSFDNWRKRLAISQEHKTVATRRAAVAALNINFMTPGEADEGYYRKSITEKAENGSGRNIVTGWTPVAYFMDDGHLVCHLGDKEVNAFDQELWSWVVSNPIPYEWYQAVAERGEPWPDMKEVNVTPEAAKEMVEQMRPVNELVPAANRDVTASDNKPPIEPLDVEHAAAIDNAIGAAKDLPVTNVEEAARAAGAANIIRERRLAAEKAAKRLVDPLKLAYDDERGKWLPIVNRAKNAEDAIRAKVSTFERDETRRITQEQLEAMEKQRVIDEEAARAADRAIAAGAPEPPPVVEEVVIPQAAPPVTPSYGNYKPRAKPILKFAVINDWNTTVNYFSRNPDFLELIQKLATNDIRAGLEVPGATFREGTE